MNTETFTFGPNQVTKYEKAKRQNMSRYNSSNWGSGIGLFGVFLVMTAIILAGTMIYKNVRASYIFEKEYTSSWYLADKSSTIQAKAEYINVFVDTILSNLIDFAEYNAVFLQTPDNKLENNVKALVSLRDRLNQIKTMDEKDFAYQTAIQQITAQEQGEAYMVISNIEGCWELENYPMIWNWYAGLWIALIVVLGFVGLICVLSD